MEQFRINTDNAIELYLRDSTVERARALFVTLAAWPARERLQHAGLLMACFDALHAKYGDEFGRRTFGIRSGQWIVRAVCPEWKPTWGDYWLLYWKLTRDRPGLARLALKNLHRRGWHLPYALEQPRWMMAESCAVRLIRQECSRNPEFQAAIEAEIKASPCGSHGVACP